MTLLDQLASLLHDLRNPLTAVIGYGEMLQEDLVSGADPQVLKESADIVVLRSRAMGRLLERYSEILYWREKHLAPGGQITEFDVGILLRTLAETASANLSTMPSLMDPLLVRGDKKRLGKILQEVLDNARQYGRGPAALELDVQDHTLTIKVSDRGPGWPAEVLDRLGEPFNKSSGSSGSGLGLAWCQAGLEAMGGHLTLENKDPGAMVLLHLPRG